MTHQRNREADLFIILAYDMLRAEMPKGGLYDRLHTVWNGFNHAFRRVFPGLDPVEYTKFLAEEGLIQLSPSQGGAFLKPCKHFIAEAQQVGQEEIGLQMLKFLEDCAAANKPPTKVWEPGDTAKRLKQLGYG